MSLGLINAQKLCFNTYWNCTGEFPRSMDFFSRCQTHVKFINKNASSFLTRSTKGKSVLCEQSKPRSSHFFQTRRRSTKWNGVWLTHAPLRPLGLKVNIYKVEMDCWLWVKDLLQDKEAYSLWRLGLSSVFYVAVWCHPLFLRLALLQFTWAWGAVIPLRNKRSDHKIQWLSKTSTLVGCSGGRTEEAKVTEFPPGSWKWSY